MQLNGNFLRFAVASIIPDNPPEPPDRSSLGLSYRLIARQALASPPALLTSF